jgi:hypothetical protein
MARLKLTSMLCNCPRCLGQFNILLELYRGKMSRLYKAMDICSGSYVALKQYKKAALSPLNRYVCECVSRAADLSS